MLIPTVLALSEFFASNFPNISWYPYWYLGNPYHYLIGPVVPTLLAILNITHSTSSGQIVNIYLGLIGVSFLVGSVGLYLFLRDFGVGKRAALLSGILYIVLPVGFFLLFYQNGLNHIAMGVLPYILLLYRRFLQKPRHSGPLTPPPLPKGEGEGEGGLFLIPLMALMITLILLINISTLLPLVIGIIALLVALEKKEKVEEKIGKTILIILLSLSLSTLWYTPKFWWVIATNPSLGGIPLGKLAWSILQFLLQFLPIALAIAVVKWRKFKLKGHLRFGFLFFASFLFLSLVRFVSDPDFVMDWISFGLELQFGGAILLASALAKIKSQKSKVKIDSVLSFRSGEPERNPLGISRFVRDDISCYFRLLIFLVILSSIIFDVLMLGRLANQFGDEYKSRIIAMLGKNVKEDERVFLSGSSVFFINSKLNIQQLRGGVDQGSIHPFWAHGAYQVREGTDDGLAYDWLRSLGVYYILVHDKYSDEAFGDFKYPDKFSFCHPEFISGSNGIPKQVRNDNSCVNSALFQLVSQNRGDLLYKVNGASIGRVADEQILNVQKPENGADKQAIHKYINALKRPLAINLEKPNQISIKGNFREGEVGSLAVSYENLWQIASGRGIIVSDPLGNIVVIPKKTGLQRFELAYKRNLLDLAIPLGLSIVIVIILVKYHKIAPYVRKMIPKLHVGLRDEED